MAKKYLDTELLIDELGASCMPIFEKGISGILGDDESIADVIRSQPAADVQEVRHGHWIFRDKTKLIPTGKLAITEGYAWINERNLDKAVTVLKKHITVKQPICSVCGYYGDDECDATPYCPNCGAIMDGEENDEIGI